MRRFEIILPDRGRILKVKFIGPSPSGKALGFDPSMRRFDKIVWNDFELERSEQPEGLRTGRPK